VTELHGRRLHPYEVIEAAAAAADSVDSSVFFAIVLPDRLLVRIETESISGDPRRVAEVQLGGLPVEIERTAPGSLLDVDLLGSSPSVYKPVLVSDWRQPGRRLMSVSQGMIDWPRPSFSAIWRWLRGNLRTARRRRQLERSLRRDVESTR
jgi:hypothetical protein